MVALRSSADNRGDIRDAVRRSIRNRDWLFVTDVAEVGSLLLWLGTAPHKPASLAALVELPRWRGPGRRTAVVVFPRHSLTQANVEHLARKLGRPAPPPGWLVQLPAGPGLMSDFIRATLSCDAGPLRAEVFG